MVQTVPFRGLRYTAPYTRATVFSPPYDVIDPEQRRRYLEGDAHNIVAIDLAPGAGDANWYAEAADTMARWLEEGVLAHDESPAFYGYRQHFSLGGREQVRTGYIGRVRLQEWGQGIHRHELTRVGPRADRLRLMQALHANTSPVFGMYRDPQGDIARHLEPPATTAVDVVDEDGVRHIFWPIVDPQTIAALSAAMADRDIVIADGHHRYETAMAYRAGRRAAEDDPVEPQPYDYVLMYLTAAEDPGLCILPTHRVIAATGGGGPDDATLLDALRIDFDIEPFEGPGSLSDAVADAARDRLTIGVCLPQSGSSLLRLKDLARARRAAGDTVAAELADLDVVVLQNLVLAPHLGITREVLAHGERVSYTIHEDRACAQVAAGEARAAFILSPTTVEQVWQAAVHGITMPQKSTYFYPKLLTGLVINPLDE